MSDLRHDGLRSSHGPDASANTMENLAHDEIADIIARLSEVDEKSSAKRSPGNAKDGRPVVSAIPTEETK